MDAGLQESVRPELQDVRDVDGDAANKVSLVFISTEERLTSPDMA
jgi:hypothetical protein